MKKLTIVEEVPDGFANELERGTGNLAEWAGDALRRHWEGELEEIGEGGRGKGGFRVVEARIGKAEPSTSLRRAAGLAHGWKFGLGRRGPSEDDIKAGRTELLAVKLDEANVLRLELLASKRGCTTEECLRQLLEEDTERNREPLAAVEGGAA